MTVEALIGDDWMRAGIKVIFRTSHPGQPTLYDNGREQAVVSDGTEISIEPILLTEDRARALLGALLRHYEGGEDTRSLRRDYDAERKRVDLFIAHLTAQGGSHV